MIATVRKEQHWLLNDADAKIYGAAVWGAMRHFPVGVSQKAIDIGAAIMMVISMESPRVWASAEAAKARRAPPPRPQPSATVYRFTDHNPQAAGSPSPASAAAQQPGGGAVEGFRPEGSDDPAGDQVH